MFEAGRCAEPEDASAKQCTRELKEGRNVNDGAKLVERAAEVATGADPRRTRDSATTCRRST